MIKNCFKIILEWYFLPSGNVEDLPCAVLCSLLKSPPHQRFAYGVFTAWLLLGCYVPCCPLEKNPKEQEMLEYGCIYIYLLLSLFPFPGEDFGGRFRGRTVSSMVWGIEHCLLLRSPFTADRFYHIYHHYLALW